MKSLFIPDAWTTVTADKGLKATQDEYEALTDALYPDEADESELDEYSGFDAEYSDGNVYVFAENWEDCDWNAFPQAFLALLGALIAKNGLEYLEFGPADVNDEPKMGTYREAHGYFRVRSNGSIWEPRLTW